MVLRVSLDALSKRGSAIQLKDCRCIGLSVAGTVTGGTVAKDLDGIFTRAGHPRAIIKDCGATLQKGVRLWSEKQTKPVPVIEDIGHSMALALKKQFGKTGVYKRFTALLSHGGKCLRQTESAFLMPPGLRSKGRFQSISKLGKWGEKMLPVFAKPGAAKQGTIPDKLRTVFPGFLQMKGFIKRFAGTTAIVSEVPEILKNKGLNQLTHKKCLALSKALPGNSQVKKHLQEWLKKHLEIQKELTGLPLLVSSGIIESLSGNFRHIIERSPQADMNRSVLLIPALCGNLDEATVGQALSKASCADLKKWEEDNIPYTMRKKRQEFFENQIQKPGKDVANKAGVSTG